MKVIIIFALINICILISIQNNSFLDRRKRRQFTQPMTNDLEHTTQVRNTDTELESLVNSKLQNYNPPKQHNNNSNGSSALNNVGDIIKSENEAIIQDNIVYPSISANTNKMSFDSFMSTSGQNQNNDTFLTFLEFLKFNSNMEMEKANKARNGLSQFNQYYTQGPAQSYLSGKSFYGEPRLGKLSYSSGSSSSGTAYSSSFGDHSSTQVASGNMQGY